MNKALKKIVLVTAFIHSAVINTTTSHPSYRSQSVNAAREIVGWQQFINLPTCAPYGAFYIAPEYTQTFRSDKIARDLFGTNISCGSNCGSSIKISGSRVVDRGAQDWLADYFGLPTDFESTLNFNPRIQNFLVDFNVFVGLQRGLYFRIHAPLVYTRWALQFTEDDIVPGVAQYEPGYFTDAAVLRNNLLPNATAYFGGTTVPNLGSGYTFQPLTCSKLTSACDCNNNPRTLTRLSDIEAAFGWNYWCDEDYLFGLSIRASAPTTKNNCDEFLFSPVIGSGGHWKLGAGINAQALIWRDDVENTEFGIYFDAHIQHIFNACQTRCFDLCGKPNSRYMLAQKLGTQRLPLQLIGASDAGVEFQNTFAPVANLTTAQVNVSSNVEADVVIKLAYYTCNWSWDFGYNYWGRSCEKICVENCIPALDGRTWALKGDASVIGFVDEGSDATSFVRLAAVQTDATIYSGTNNYVGPNGDDGGINGVRPTANPGITNPIELIGVNGATGNLDVVDRFPAGIGVITRSSNPVTFLTARDVDFSGTKGSSNKVFMHASYAWNNCTRTPYLGFGGEIEFARNNFCNNSSVCVNSNCTITDCEQFCPRTTSNNCAQAALNQWGIWVKGGAAFN